MCCVLADGFYLSPYGGVGRKSLSRWVLRSTWHLCESLAAIVVQCVLWSIASGMITYLTFSCDEQTWRAIWYTASKSDECKTHDCIRYLKCISNNRNHPNEGIRRDCNPSNTNCKTNNHPALLPRFFRHIRDGEKIHHVDWKAKEPAKSSRQPLRWIKWHPYRETWYGLVF